MLQPSSGTALIHGRDIRTHMAAIRTSLGICPQFDVLWPDLTVREHLQLYARIKGLDRAAAAQAAADAAEEVGRPPRTSQYVQLLSHTPCMRCFAPTQSGI
jgi:ABC-type multidrug transport system ATPase subunit